MLERSLKDNPKVKNILEAPEEQMLVEIAVEGGARVEGKTLQEIRLPAGPWWSASGGGIRT